MTKVTDLTTKFIADVKAAQAAFRQEGETLLKEVTKQFFIENPEVKAIKWEQYTPYFNDGDTCEFSVHEVAFVNTDDPAILSDVRYGEYDGDDESVKVFSRWGDDPSSQQIADNIKAMDSFLSAEEMSDVMQAVFEDHVVVTATAAGFAVEEFEHD